MDAQGYVPMSLIAGFNKVQQLTKDLRLIIEVSDLVVFLNIKFYGIFELKIRISGFTGL